MTTAQVLLFAVVFVSASFAAMVLLTQMSSGRMRRRLKNIGEGNGFAKPKGEDGWIRTAVKLSGPFARLSLPKEGWQQSPLRLAFMHAGYRGESAPILYFGAKTLLAVVLPAITFLVIASAASGMPPMHMLAILLGIAAFGYYLPSAVLSRTISHRQRGIFEEFPDAADLMLVCVEAGLGLDAALNRVADEMRMKSEALAEELQLVNLEMRAGATREKALRNLAMRTGVEEVNIFATMLIQADRFGTSVGDSLRVFSDELRTRRKYRAEELAAKIPIKLLFPLVFFIFPSLLLVLLGPAFIQIHNILLPTLHR